MPKNPECVDVNLSTPNLETVNTTDSNSGCNEINLESSQGINEQGTLNHQSNRDLVRRESIVHGLEKPKFIAIIDNIKQSWLYRNSSNIKREFYKFFPNIKTF